MSKNKTLTELDRVVPDTSVIIEGIISKQLGSNELKVNTIIMHEAVLAELESQANKGRETGLLGLEEITRIRELSTQKGFTIEYKGSRPGDFEIKFAKTGEIDSLIRDLAFHEKATLITADIVQSKVAEAKGISVYLYTFPQQDNSMLIEKYFDDNTMSVHLKENCSPMAKKGAPGSWKYVSVAKKKLSADDMKELSKDIIEKAKMREDGFIEMERKGSTVLQVGKFRIVLVRPPFSDGYEITAVKPIRKLELKDYTLTPALKDRIMRQAEGILVAGAPGHGKSTFVQALAQEYHEKGKNVKTVESPRDMVVPDEITQYSLTQGSNTEIHDILLLSRPDFTIFDEIRNQEDFRLFADLRLSGIGMLGVIHATEPIDAIQRFVGKIELGMIPHIVDTVLYVKNGNVAKSFSLSIQVKVPVGMSEADLARPIVVVHDFETGRLEFEIYSYGEETIVVPVSAANAHNPLQRLALKQLKEEFRKYDEGAIVDLISEGKVIVSVLKEKVAEIIGKNGFNVTGLEKRLGLKIDVQERTEQKTRGKSRTLNYDTDTTEKEIILKVEPGHEEKPVDIYIDNEFFLAVKTSKKGQIKLARTSATCRSLLESMRNGKQIRLMG